MTGLFQRCFARSTLTGLIALLRLVDHIDAAFTAHDLAIAVTRLERAERIRNLHRSSPYRGAFARNGVRLENSGVSRRKR